MLTYTVSSSQLAERDIYEIKEVSSLAEFLKPENSLCIVKTPFEGTRPEMIRIDGKDKNGEPMRIYLDNCSRNLGYLKSKLDRTLYSPFLFISWKQKGFHTFKLVKERQTLAEFPDFQSALEVYFPDGFIPEHSYRRNRTVFELWCRSIKRHNLFVDLLTVLDRKIAKMKKETL
ncbi:MAG: hypothetical protein E7050_04465 [Lentisphaerae bacterium]|nr:hypothetical protein [Lentisphaerota bacterium]